MNDRIKSLIKQLGLSKRAFALSCGLPQNTLNNQLNGIRDLSLSTVTAILKTYSNVSSDWLMRGEGDMLLDPNTAASSEGGIPLIPVEAMAGFLSGEVSVSESECERLSIPGLKADFVIPVSGDSMEPKYFSGDYVACQHVNLDDIFFQWGKVYVIDTNQGILLKKVRKAPDPHSVLLISENPDYDPITMPRENIYHVALVKGLVRII